MKIVIVWDDGTKTETEIHPPPKVTEKVFEPIDIHFGCFTVSVTSENDIMVANGPSYSSCVGCIQSPRITRKFIAALQSAIGFVEKNK